MFSDLERYAYHYHAEYRRRNVKLPEPLEQPRDGWKRAIGHGLIHLGERLANVERRPHPVDEAA
jgi:hypothetical protein